MFGGTAAKVDQAFDLHATRLMPKHVLPWVDILGLSEEGGIFVMAATVSLACKAVSNQLLGQALYMGNELRREAVQHKDLNLQEMTRFGTDHPWVLS